MPRDDSDAEVGLDPADSAPPDSNGGEHASSTERSDASAIGSSKKASIGGRIRAAWENRAARFVFLFLLYLGIASIAYPEFRTRYRPAMEALMEATAKLEYFMFLPFTDDVGVRGTLVEMKGFSVKIIEECTGVYEAIIFSAAVLAFPTTWAKRGIGLGFGIPAIYGFNALRIMVLILVGRYFPDQFEFMHLYFWQATLIAMITSVWALWIFKVVIREPAPQASG